MRLSFFLLTIVSVLFVLHCKADLPIHCLRSQVLGSWKLFITEPTDSNKTLTCGHETPDDPARSYLALRSDFAPSQVYTVSLEKEHQVKHNGSVVGNWTMIYDEGYDIRFNNKRFVAFFDYYPNETGQVVSYCGGTVVGWYLDSSSGKRACFKGEKIISNENEKLTLIGVPLKQVSVVQPTVTGFLQLGYTSSEAKKFRGASPTVFHKQFSDHEYFADQINKLPNKLWKAAVHSVFENMTLSELNSFAGRKKFGGGDSTERPSLKSSSNPKDIDVSDLPKQFSWKDYLSEPREQKKCGSCYVFATMSMLEARIKIKYGKDVQLSVEHVLDCSYQNQGCHGGYPYFVGMFAKDHELVPESCSPYNNGKSHCSKCDIKSLPEHYKVSDHKFVGGAYGDTNHRNMMLEVMSNGPIVFNFEPSANFMYYTGGVYHGIEAEWIKKGLDKPEWERVDHSVLLYGWGETEAGEKYWNLMNSWGRNWGENGHFRMIRGVDESACESFADAADPIIVKH